MNIQWFDRETLDRIVPNYIREADIVLDIGCGIRPQEVIKPKLRICVEPYEEYVQVLREKYQGAPDVSIIQNTALEAVSTFSDKSVDSVFLVDLIEHMGKEDGKRLIHECERITRQQIILFTPLGFMPQPYEFGDKDAWGLHGGQWQEHKSGWMPEDFDSSWTIRASKAYHTKNVKDEPLDPPAGAFWAIKNIREGGFKQEIVALPLVTIITPAYNRASYLDETIQSILKQDYPKIEYIVLDDGSKDNTKDVLEKYSGRLTWESHPNMGETRTVNKGFKMAHGEIIAVVNSDDPLLPGAVGAAVSFMQSNPEIIVAYPDWDFIDPNSKITGHLQVPDYDYLFMVRRHHCSPGPGAFIRRGAVELAKGRDPEFKYVADFEYWLRLGLYGKFARIPKTLATFRVHPDSASVAAKGKSMAEEHIRLVKKLFSRPDLPTEVIKTRGEAFCWAYLVAGVCFGTNRFMTLIYFIRALLYHPPSFYNNPAQWQYIIFYITPKPIYNLLLKIWRTVRSLFNRTKGLFGKHALKEDAKCPRSA
jgi:glycosyltransferase involved in cell wall biosynthesis